MLWVDGKVIDVRIEELRKRITGNLQVTQKSKVVEGNITENQNPLEMRGEKFLNATTIEDLKPIVKQDYIVFSTICKGV